MSDLYPQGRCDACGFGLWEDMTCKNPECIEGEYVLRMDLADLEAIFVANGGRGVDVAEQIDLLRQELGLDNGGEA